MVRAQITFLRILALLPAMPPLLGGHEGLRDEVQFLSLINGWL
jgi:hypothetical protein